MKTAKPPQAEAGPSARRAQPVRQTRTNPPRTTSAPSRPLGGREALGGGQNHNQPIDIFPALWHFTDAITSLPKELVRHFTLLKEVDAKIFAPEEALFQLVDAALKSIPPEPRKHGDGSSSAVPASAPMSTQNSSIGHPAPASANESRATTVFDPSNLPRRTLFVQTSFKIQEMLVSLEEKNHVISTANEALSKQLARINDVWPHLENEFSDEAKWGSTTHWAYPENRVNRANQAERSRRDGAAAITAAAQQLQVEEAAAARSDARKQALMAKKGLKNQHQDSDADDQEGKQKGDSTKKAQGTGKTRKTADATTPVGLGISGGANANSNPPSKRRKVDNSNKTANGGQPMERAMSSVYGSNAAKPKNASPRATPVPEPTKKRKALPTANGASKKSKTTLTATALSPSIPSPTPQPVASDKPATRGSPAAAATVSPRPASSRARQNSIQSNVENGRQRPASSASNRPNGITSAPPEALPLASGPRASAEPKATKEPTALIKTEAIKEELVVHVPSAANGNNKKDNAPKPDESEATKTEPPQAQAPATTTTTTAVVTTKSGRASKPSTPALGSFPDPPPRSRASRNNTSSNTTTTTTTAAAKRSHKKGASQHAISTTRITTAVAGEDLNININSRGGGDDEVDANEPLYCYCNGVSYGEMVACDHDDCEREWFHLDCVGLKAAPPSSVKWYCDNCKDRMKTTGKKVNGR
ncbi:hypothetical protein F5Y17DRAFT_33136 [Xylariaceae sp. FL0594]|nr:hypothetical protein F5Y17DRAFT_33136 [Xylariaceae sp. FL0594]